MWAPEQLLLRAHGGMEEEEEEEGGPTATYTAPPGVYNNLQASWPRSLFVASSFSPISVGNHRNLIITLSTCTIPGPAGYLP